ncbi:MAG: hypothetical protein M3132_00065 [Actinomycetia bacterium]|nr:hypothetical protein [Actinomycetes bacterium]
MWKSTMVVIGGAALAVSLPFVALAVTTGEEASDVAPATVATDQVQNTLAYQYDDELVDPALDQVQAQIEEQLQIQDPQVVPVTPAPVVAQDQTMIQQRLREHIETGPPEGVDPVQQRLQQHDQLRLQDPDHAVNPDAPMGQGGPPADMAPGDATQHRGNPDASMAGDGTGDCVNEEPLGTGPHGPGGANNG